MDLIARWMIKSFAKKHNSDKGCSKYKVYDQFVALTFGQLCKCYTLNDISTGLGVSDTFIWDLGLNQSPTRDTMNDGNKKRDWKVFESLYYRLLKQYERVLKRESQGKRLKSKI